MSQINNYKKKENQNLKLRSLTGNPTSNRDSFNTVHQTSNSRDRAQLTIKDLKDLFGKNESWSIFQSIYSIELEINHVITLVFTTSFLYLFFFCLILDPGSFVPYSIASSYRTQIQGYIVSSIPTTTQIVTQNRAQNTPSEVV